MELQKKHLQAIESCEKEFSVVSDDLNKICIQKYEASKKCTDITIDFAEKFIEFEKSHKKVIFNGNTYYDVKGQYKFLDLSQLLQLFADEK